MARLPSRYAMGRLRPILRPAFAAHLQQQGGAAGVSYALSTLTAASATGVGDGTTTNTLTLTARDTSNALMAGRAVTWTRELTAVSAAQSSITAGPGTIASTSGTSTITVTVKNAAGVALPNIAASRVVLAATGTGNTLTQPTAATNLYGMTTGTIASTVAATKVVSVTVDGVAVTATVSVVVTGAAITYPNQPAGYTAFALWNADADGLPDSTPSDGAAYIVQSSALLTINATPPSPPAGYTNALRLKIQAGTPAGYNQPGSEFSNWGMWDLVSDLSNTEYSEFYEHMYINAWGYNGTSCETPPPGWKIVGYWGSTNNNQNPATGPGPVQFLNFFAPVDGNAANPMVATQFRPRISTQNGTNVTYEQTLNMGTLLTIGTTHRWEAQFKLNDVGSTNGVVRCWLDGVLVIEATTNVEFINAAFAQYGSTGLSGFFGRLFSIVWGGQGGANMTQDHYLYYYSYYASGVFLRAAAP